MIAEVQGSVLVTGGLLIALVLVLAFLLLRRPEAGRTRVGVFVDRQRAEEPWPELSHPEPVPEWLDKTKADKTAELPPPT